MAPGCNRSMRDVSEGVLRGILRTWRRASLHPRDLLDLTGRVAVVTGASQGIGAGIATRFAAAGASVVVHYRRGREAADESWTAITAARADGRSLSGPTSTDEARVDAPVPADARTARAGRHPGQQRRPELPAPPARRDGSLAEWQAMFRDNLESMFLCTRRRRGVMRERGGGAIVNIGVDLGVEPGHRPQPLQQRKGRGPDLHPVRGAGARAVRDPGQRRVARA